MADLTTPTFTAEELRDRADSHLNRGLPESTSAVDSDRLRDMLSFAASLVNENARLTASNAAWMKLRCEDEAEIDAIRAQLARVQGLLLAKRHDILRRCSEFSQTGNDELIDGIAAETECWDELDAALKGEPVAKPSTPL